MAPAPHRVYSQELSSAFRRGHPIANPQAAVYKAGNSEGGGIQRSVEIGDVGYIHPGHGYFVRLFNVHLEPGVDGQPTRDRLPDDFEVLPREDTITITDNTPLFLSRTVTTKSVSAAASGPFFGGSVVFSTTSKRGAILATPDPIECTDASCIPIYMRHARAHIQSWYDFFSQRYLIELEDLILVTGIDRTTSWATAVISDTQLEAGFGLEVQFATGGAGVQLACQYSWQSTFGALVNSGPRRGSNPSGSNAATPPSILPDDSGLSDSMIGDVVDRAARHQPLNTQSDQTLFIRHIRAKRRSRWLGMKLAAAGEKDDTDDEGDYSDSDCGAAACHIGDMLIDVSPEHEEFVDCLEPALDFILENSESDIALAHHDDLVAIPSSSSTLRCPIEVQDGVGTLKSSSSLANKQQALSQAATCVEQSQPSSSLLSCAASIVSFEVVDSDLRMPTCDLSTMRILPHLDTPTVNERRNSECHEGENMPATFLSASAIRALFDRPLKGGGRPLPQPPFSAHPTLNSPLSRRMSPLLKPPVTNLRPLVWSGVPLVATTSLLPYPRNLPAPPNTRPRSNHSGNVRRSREASAGGSLRRPQGARARWAH